METRRQKARSSASAVPPPLASSPESSHSARTIGSSPISSPTASTPTPLYRQVRELPYELRQHVIIYFEEGLYCQAIGFLQALLSSGMTSASPQPAILPPSQHLALIATLSVHPTFTTRAKTLEHLTAANLSLQYLQLVLRHVGPLRDVLGDAFVFTGQGHVARRGTKSRRRITGEDASPTTEYSDSIESELANAASLWARTDSIWQVIGWAFNCSILYKRRWERWSAWLIFVIELLETDWEKRRADLNDDALRNSLIVRYIKCDGSAAGNERKILRAVFADGRPKSTGEFGEIWQNETKELRKNAALKKAEAKIDIEADDYGDYMQDEDDADLEDSASDRSSSPLNLEDHPFGPTTDISKDLGGMDSINFRIRLLSLLSKASDRVPESFTPVNTLYQLFFEHIRPLPIPAFFAIMSPAGIRFFEPTAASTLTQYILRSIIAAAAPLPPNDDISQDILETSYLPFAANTNSIIDNTKVSLCVETLLRLLDQHVGLEWTPEFQDLAEAGIMARMKKAKRKQAKRSMDGDAGNDGSFLNPSAERIRMVVEMSRL